MLIDGQLYFRFATQWTSCVFLKADDKLTLTFIGNSSWPYTQSPWTALNPDEANLATGGVFTQMFPMSDLKVLPKALASGDTVFDSQLTPEQRALIKERRECAKAKLELRRAAQ